MPPNRTTANSTDANKGRWGFMPEDIASAPSLGKWGAMFCVKEPSRLAPVDWMAPWIRRRLAGACSSVVFDRTDLHVDRDRRLVGKPDGSRTPLVATGG